MESDKELKKKVAKIEEIFAKVQTINNLMKFRLLITLHREHNKWICRLCTFLGDFDSIVDHFTKEHYEEMSLLTLAKEGD